MNGYIDVRKPILDNCNGLNNKLTFLIGLGFLDEGGRCDIVKNL
jgi:hypothetical protein